MKKLGELIAEEYMTSQTICVDDTDRLTSAIKTMESHGLSVLPVVDNQGCLVGILSTSDLIEIIHEIQSDISALTLVTEKTRDFLINMLIEQGDFTKVGDVMTSPVETITAKTNLVVAARKLAERKIHHLPVIDEGGLPVGILSSFDLVRAIADHGAMIAG